MERAKNANRRKITFSKRKARLFRKANELSVLFDARVACFVVSNVGTLHTFTTPSTFTEKEAIDEYQRAIGIDLWSEHYERMEEDLKTLKEANMSLKREIERRTGGESLNDLSFGELCALESEMELSVAALRQRKFLKIRVQLDSSKKEIKRRLAIMENLLTNNRVDGWVYDHIGDRHLVASLLNRQHQDEDESESCLTS